MQQRDGARHDEAVRAEAAISIQPLPVHLLDGPTADPQSLASSRWLTPFDRSNRMYSRCWSVRLGRRPGKRPSARALAWPATERSLIEFRATTR